MNISSLWVKTFRSIFKTCFLIYCFFFLKATNRLYGVIKSQVEEFKKGFYSILPFDFVSVFTPKQLEDLLIGDTNIDVKDLVENLEYADLHPDQKYVTMFKNVLLQLDQKQLAQFVLFVTG